MTILGKLHVKSARLAVKYCHIIFFNEVIDNTHLIIYDKHMTMNYGKFVKGIRKKFDLTQEQLAVLVGVKRTTIANYELNNIKPSADVLVKLQKINGAYHKIF